MRVGQYRFSVLILFRVTILIQVFDLQTGKSKKKNLLHLAQRLVWFLEDRLRVMGQFLHRFNVKIMLQFMQQVEFCKTIQPK
jgi:hypothetical protein